jgi:glutaminyl-peptide cyclotransferase
VDGYRIVREYPHDPMAVHPGDSSSSTAGLYESTGLNRQSTDPRVRLEDGKVLRSVSIPPQYFGEGLVNWGPDLLSLTWQDGVGFAGTAPISAPRASSATRARAGA